MGISGVFPNNFVEEFFETVEEKPKPGCPPLRFLSFFLFLKKVSPDLAPPKAVRSVDVAKPESKPEPEPAKPTPAAGASRPAIASRLSKVELDKDAEAPAVGTRPGVVAKPAAPKPTESSSTTTGSADAAAPAFEKKKFSTPSVGAKPAAGGAPVEDELAKKLSVRNAASEGGDVPAKPEPALPARSGAAAAPAEPPLPQKPALASRPVPQKPSVTTSQPAPAPAIVEPTSSTDGDDPGSPDDNSPKLHHATKDRPKIGSNRRLPQRKSFSGIGSDRGEEEPPATPARPAEKPVIADKAPPESKLPEKPKPAFGSSPALLSASPASRSNSADSQSISELKEYFQKELEAMKKELGEERTLRRALEDRVARLESKK